MEIKNLVLLLVLVFGFSDVSAQDSVAAVTSNLEGAVAKPIETTPKQKMIKSDGSPLENCSGTAQQAVRECLSPSSGGMKKAAQMLTTIPSIATAFMAGGDAGKMANMCKMTALAGMLGGLLNGGQNRTCQDAAGACEESCGQSKQILTDEANEAASSGDQATYNFKRQQISQVDQTKDECINKVEQQMQLAQQQQQANQEPMGGAEACQAALDPEPEDEIVDCGLDQFKGYPECSTVSKLDPIDSTFEPGIALGSDPAEIDLPEADDREEYWNSLKNKAGGGAGGGSGMGAGAGALGGGSNGGSGSKSDGQSGGGRRKSGSAMVSGGTATSGSNSGWNTGDSDFNKKFAKLKAKKKGLKMLTKKKLGGRGLAGSEFAMASEDIWTRVYLRTNTRCTKQLTDCNANKSKNPYGKNITESL